MDGVGDMLERLNAAVGPAVVALPGWHWWDDVPDATSVPAGWIELLAGQRWEADPSLYVAGFQVVGAVPHQVSAPTRALEVAFTDTVVLALQPSPLNMLSPVSLTWQTGEVDIGSVTHRAVLVAVSLLYSTC